MKAQEEVSWPLWIRLADILDTLSFLKYFKAALITPIFIERAVSYIVAQ